MNYVPFVRWHSNCDQDGGLIDEVGGLTFGEQNNPGFNTGDGILDGSVDCPNDAIASNNQGFARTCGAGEPWDLTGQDVTKGVMMFWCRSDGLNGGTPFHVLAEQTGTTEQEKAWAIQRAYDLGSSNYTTIVYVRDNVAGSWGGIQVPTGGLGAGETYPDNEWMFHGWTWDLDANVMAGWWYSSAGKFWTETADVLAAGRMLNYSTREVTWFSANNSGGSIGQRGVNGDLDHISILHGIKFTQDDVDWFWNDGDAQPFPNGFVNGNSTDELVTPNQNAFSVIAQRVKKGRSR